MANRENNGFERLIAIHQLHLGLYAKVAKRLGTSPSYISLVARGHRSSEKIRAAITRELRRIHDITVNT